MEKTISLNIKEACAVRDALIDAALALATKPDGVVMAEADFLSQASQGRKERYLMLMGFGAELADWVRFQK